jgi:hypothetical protein
MKCKYVEQNNKEHKCSDYFMHHGHEIRCRLPEWKRKKGICPYNKNIVSKSLKTNTTRKKINSKEQKTITDYK